MGTRIAAREKTTAHAQEFACFTVVGGWVIYRIWCPWMHQGRWSQTKNTRCKYCLISDPFLIIKCQSFKVEWQQRQCNIDFSYHPEVYGKEYPQTAVTRLTLLLGCSLAGPFTNFSSVNKELQSYLKSEFKRPINQLLSLVWMQLVKISLPRMLILSVFVWGRSVYFQRTKVQNYTKLWSRSENSSNWL